MNLLKNNKCKIFFVRFSFSLYIISWPIKCIWIIDLYVQILIENFIVNVGF